MAAHANEQAAGRVYDVARLGVIAAPCGLEAHSAQLGDPFRKHLGSNLQELLGVDFEVLARVCGVLGGGGAAYDLPRLCQLLAIDCGEAAIVAAVYEHVQRIAVLAQKRQPLGDEGLMAHGEQPGLDAELPGEFLCPRAHGVHKDRSLVVHVSAVVAADRDAVHATVLLYVYNFRILKHLPSGADAQLAHGVYGLARRSLPAVQRNEGVAVDVQ